MGLFTRIKTGIITALAGFRSVFEIRKAESLPADRRRSDGPSRYRYVGPRDDKNRPFCRKILDQNRLFTLEEIVALDSDPLAQILPVFAFGGGFNCRHRWIFTERR